MGENTLLERKRERKWRTHKERKWKQKDDGKHVSPPDARSSDLCRLHRSQLVILALSFLPSISLSLYFHSLSLSLSLSLDSQVRFRWNKSQLEEKLMKGERKDERSILMYRPKLNVHLSFKPAVTASDRPIFLSFLNLFTSLSFKFLSLSLSLIYSNFLSFVTAFF